MATISLSTPNKTTTKTITGAKALAMLDGFAKAYDYDERKLANETKEEFFHRILFRSAIAKSAQGSEKIAKEAVVVTPGFTSNDIA